MSTIGRVSGSYTAQTRPEEPTTEATGHAEEHSLLEAAMEHNETIGKIEDSVWTGLAAMDHGAAVFGRVVGGTANEARLAGAAAGVIKEVIHPTPHVAGEALEHAGEALGEHGSSFTGQFEHFLEHTTGGRVLDAGLRGAAVAEVAYNVYKDMNDQTFNTTGARVANAAVDAGITALMFTGPVGDAVMAAELVTGGGVSGSAKGIVAVGEGMWTGDDAAVNKWTEGARQGEYGWLVKAAANNETVAAVGGAVASTAAAAVVTVAKPIAEGVEALAHTQAGQAVIGEVQREAALVGDAAVAVAHSRAGRAVANAAVSVANTTADAAVAVAHSAVGQEVAREARVVGHAAVVAGHAIADTATAVANSRAGQAVEHAAVVAGHAVADAASAVANSTVGRLVGSGSSTVGHAIRDGANAVSSTMRALPKLEDKILHQPVSTTVSQAWHALTSW